ncbi:MAG: hypothetical protein Q7T82_11145 [Armatimonadota bacterium]|nr:hypothetical protein [Armatimonadota bacterium]
MMITSELLAEFDSALAKLKEAAEHPELVTQSQEPHYTPAPGGPFTRNTIEIVVRSRQD